MTEKPQNSAGKYSFAALDLVDYLDAFIAGRKKYLDRFHLLHPSSRRGGEGGVRRVQRGALMLIVAQETLTRLAGDWRQDRELNEAALKLINNFQRGF